MRRAFFCWQDKCNKIAAVDVLPERSDDDEEDWTYITSDDGDSSCSVCGEPIHAGQAVGYVHRQTIHARCYRPRT